MIVYRKTNWCIRSDRVKLYDTDKNLTNNKLTCSIALSLSWIPSPDQTGIQTKVPSHSLTHSLARSLIHSAFSWSEPWCTNPIIEVFVEVGPQSHREDGEGEKEEDQVCHVQAVTRRRFRHRRRRRLRLRLSYAPFFPRVFQLRFGFFSASFQLRLLLIKMVSLYFSFWCNGIPSFFPERMMNSISAVSELKIFCSQKRIRRNFIVTIFFSGNSKSNGPLL